LNLKEWRWIKRKLFNDAGLIAVVVWCQMILKSLQEKVGITGQV